MSETTRIGDREREAMVDALRAAYRAGCLDVTELESRLDAAWASRTQPELDLLRADLPVPRPAPAPTPAPPASKPAARRRADVGFFVVAMLAMTGIWLATGAGHPWPVWVLLGWGPMVLSGRGCHAFRPGLPPGVPQHGRR